MKYSTPEAINFMMRGNLALSVMETNGVRVDRGYVEQTYKDLDDKVRDIYKRMKADKECFKPWVHRFGERTNLGSRDQLHDVLFFDLGIKPGGMTASKKRFSTDKSVLDKIDLPFVALFRQMEQYKDIQATYLDGIRREMVEVGGCWFVHPSYGLNTAATFRSNCRDPNWQNVPKRDWEIAQMVRRCYIPRPGRQFVEVDFGMNEVRFGCPYHHDPNMIRYCSDPKSDMHRDTGAKLFMLPPETVAQMKKTARHAAKNMFVFPEFFGSVYYNCAPQIWDEMTRGRWALPDGTLLVDHLKSKGIKELGDCENAKNGTRPGTFVHHLRDVEKHLWDKQFPVYRDWKRSWFDQYQREGGFSMLTGFRVNGRLTRNEVANYAIQGSAFHAELWTCIEIVKRLKKYKMDSLLVGEIHDCDVGDVTRSELQAYCDMVYRLKTEELPKAWKWINVPIEAEVEVGGPDECWSAIKVHHRDAAGDWVLKG